MFFCWYKYIPMWEVIEYQRNKLWNLTLMKHMKTFIEEIVHILVANRDALRLVSKTQDRAFEARLL